MRLQFGRGLLYLWRCGLCTVDGCERYGRLQGTKRSVYIRWLNCVGQKTKCHEDRKAADKTNKTKDNTVIPLSTARFEVKRTVFIPTCFFSKTKLKGDLKLSEVFLYRKITVQDAHKERGSIPKKIPQGSPTKPHRQHRS